MTKDEALLISGCQLCDIIKNKNIITKLYWPLDINDIPNSEFVIVDCKTCKVPMVIYKDHTTTISRESWGRMLYRCKQLFGSGVTLRCKSLKIRDHYHCHINV